MLKSCDFEIDLPGFKQNFATREELDQFIENNYERIKASMSGALVRFSKSYNSQSEVAAILSKAKVDTPTTITFDENGEKTEGLVLKPGYIGVTKDIDTITTPGGKLLFTPMNKEDFKKVHLEKILGNLKSNNIKKLSDEQLLEEATDEVNAIIKSWDLLRDTGTEIHTLASLFFDNPLIHRDELYYKAQKIMAKQKLTFTKIVSDKIHDGLSRYVTKLSRDLADTDIKYFTEVALYDDDSKIVGILDLVAVDSKGNAHILDFKISNRRFDEWDRDKERKSILQLAYYRQLLGKAGIRTRSLKLMPIYINNFDTKSDYISDIEFENNMTADVTGLLNIGDYNQWTKLIKAKIVTDESASIETRRTGNVKKTYDNFFTVKDESDEDKIARFLKYRKKNNKEGDYFRALDGKVTILSNDPATRRIEVLNQILSETLSGEDLVLNIKSKLQGLKNQMSSTTSKEVIEYENPIGAVKHRTTNHQKAFKKYMNPSWEIMNLDELEANNILGFRNKEHGQVEFVIITTEPLNVAERLSKGSSLLGNFISDQDPVIKVRNIPEATVRNKSAIKILIHINDNIDLFKDSTLHTIRVFNIMNEELEGVNNPAMIETFDYLAKENGITSRLGEMKASPAELLLRSEIYDIFENDINRSSGMTRYLNNLSTLLDTMSSDNTVYVHNLVALRKKFLTENPKYKDEVNINYDDDPLAQIFGYLNKLIAEKSGFITQFEDKNMHEYALTNSLYLSSFNEIQQQTLRSALEPIRMSKDAMAQEFTTYNDSTLRPIFEKFYKAKNASVLLGDHIGKFSNLFDTDANGKVDKQFRFKDPTANMGNNSYLDSAEREFLTTILPIMNQFMNEGKDPQEAKDQGYYYEIPLLRATTTSMIFGKGFSPGGMAEGAGNALMNAWRQGMDIFNYFDEEMDEVTRSAGQMLEVYDRFSVSKNPILREQYVAKYNHLDFEKNIELIMSTLVFDNMRKKAFDRALPITAAIMSASKLYQEGLTTKDVAVLYDYIQSYIKVVVFNDKLTEKHHEGSYQKLATIKHMVTMLQLGLAPLSMVREVLQGQINNLIKNWSKRYGDSGPSFEDYTKAVYFIGAQEVLGLDENKSFLTDVTMTESLNHMYRFANLDTSDLPEKIIISKTGVTQMTSRWFLWFTASPDYMNRMAFLVAKMIKDGSLEAHKMVDGQLKYDWRRDKRFSKYATGNKTDMAEYNNQRQLYLKFIEEFNKETSVTGVRLKQLVEGDDLPRAYTNVERESLKAFINYTLGPYDKEEKPLANSTMFGMMFFQFKTWMISKKTQYWLEGDTYSMGYWKHYTDMDGNKIYLDENNKRVLEVTDKPFWVWEGKFQEGILHSIMRTIDDFKENGYNFNETIKFANKDQEIRGNAKMALADLSVFFLISIMFKGIIDWDELEKDSKAAHAFGNAVVNSTGDLFVFNIVEAFVNPTAMFPTAGYLFDNFNSLFGAMSGNANLGRMIINSNAFTRTIDNLTNVFEE